MITIYSRPGCHLCDEMKAVVRRALAGAGRADAITEIDISGDPQLEARYGLEIPVLLMDGTKVAKYRVTEGDVRRMLDARAGRAGEAG